jgi:hypothetical protein
MTQLHPQLKRSLQPETARGSLLTANRGQWFGLNAAATLVLATLCDSRPNTHFYAEIRT